METNGFTASKKVAARFFRVSVQALDGWFTAGCPVMERDSSGRIRLLALDDMAEWRIARGDDVGALEIERTRLTKAQADKTELEVKEIRGEVVRMPLVEQHWQGMVASMRARLLALPSRAAGQVAAPDNILKVEAAIRDLVYEALAEIAGDALPAEVRDRVVCYRSEEKTEEENHASNLQRTPSPAPSGRVRRGGSEARAGT